MTASKIITIAGLIMAVKFINLVIVFVLLKLSTLMPMELSENLVFYGPHTAIQSLQDREEERNKAELNIKVFKDLTLEFSAIIGGKYGISNQEKSPDEWTWLYYSIIRTRHKFSGAKDILPRFYGVGDVNKLSSDHRAHLAAVLTIDTLAAEAIGNEDLLNQWAEIKADQPVNAKFINDVKSHAKAWTKELLVTTLEPAIDSFLQNAKTIALAHDVFSMFAPKITLRTIYSEMFNGEYRGWTVHGYSAFAKSITMNEDEKQALPDLEVFARHKFKIRENLLCLSAVAELSSTEITEKLSLKPQTLVLEYPYNECFDELSGGFAEIKPTRYLWLTREFKHSLTKTLKHPYAKVSEKSLLDIYRHRARLSNKMRKGPRPANLFQDSDLKFLISYGDILTASIFNHLIYSGECGIQKDMPKVIEFCREIADLEGEFAKRDLPSLLNDYGIALFYGKNNFEIDRDKAIELLRESKNLGSEDAKKNLALFLNNYGVWTFDGQHGVEIDRYNGIQLLREAADLGCEEAKICSLPMFLHEYGVWMFNGENGIEKDMPKAIELLRESRDLAQWSDWGGDLANILSHYGAWMFNGENGVTRNMLRGIEFLREAADLGCEEAKINLPTFLNGYGAWMFYGENGVEKDIEKALELLRESASLGNEQAMLNLRSINQQNA